MLDLISLSLSLISLALSSYAIFQNKKNEKNSLSTAMTRALTSASSSRNLSGIPAGRVLSREERRESIAAKAYDPETLKGVADGVKRSLSSSSFISPDPEAQTNLPAFRERQRKR